MEQWTVEQGPRTISHLRLWDEPLTAALDVLEALLRCPDALARVLDAVGPYIAELLGRRLMASWRRVRTSHQPSQVSTG